MNRRQDQDNGFSFGFDNESEKDLAFAKKTTSVLTGSNKTAQAMGNNTLSNPQDWRPAQCHLFKMAKQLVGDMVNVTGFDCPAEIKRLDLNFSDLEEFVVAFEAATSGSKVLNLTQHPATPDQAEAGIVEPSNKAAVQAALTFDTAPTLAEMQERADFLTALAKEGGCKKAMIGGAPFFMSALESALVNSGITPVYAFSQRVSVESVVDGVVTKTNVFKHVGFVEV